MKTGDLYNHYNGGEYYFVCVALPLKDITKHKLDVKILQTARYHEDTHDIDLYIDSNGTTFIDSDVPHVIYQSELNYETNYVYAREINNFFGVISMDNGLLQRFKPQQK